MVFSILPKNKRKSLSWASILIRIVILEALRDTKNCFRNLLTFSRLQVLTFPPSLSKHLTHKKKLFSSSKFRKLYQQNTISFISFQEALVVKKAKKAMVAKARTKANVRPLTNSGMKARHRLCKTLWHHFWLKSYQLQPTSMTLVWKFFVYWELCMLSTVIGDPYLKVWFRLEFLK